MPDATRPRASVPARSSRQGRELPSAASRWVSYSATSCRTAAISGSRPVHRNGAFPPTRDQQFRGPRRAIASRVGTRLLGRLIEAGDPVRYHGDFDWPGVSIAGRVMKQGAAAWRMSAEDYITAVSALDADHAIALTGRAAPTPGDPGLAAAMSAHGLAVLRSPR
nr:DUF2399 domain-containing protein [Actinoplanes sp. N902-109]